MRSVSETPTEPLDYAVLSAAYGSLLGTLVLAAGPGSRGEEPVRPVEIVPLGLATFALTKALVHEKVETWIRVPFLEEDEEGDRRPRGRRMRYAVGELLSCTRCLGAWSALGLVALRVRSPAAGRVVTTVLATSGVNDFLQAAFNVLTGEANLVEAQVQEAG